MNQKAEKHLAKAEGYLTRGEEFYRKAALEIVAAQKADSTLSNREIGERFGHKEAWVRKLVSWGTTSSSATTPFLADAMATTRAAISHTRSTLRDAPMEQIERIIEELPPERQAAIGAAGHDAYMGVRSALHEQERTMTPAQRGERDAAVQRTRDAVARGTAGFTSLACINHIEQAKDLLSKLVSDQVLTAETWQPIEDALIGLLDEAKVAAAMAGLELDLEVGK